MPSKVLLDRPLPDNLPVVFACEACNNAFSESEEYVACLLAAVLSGGVQVDDDRFPQAARTLDAKPALRTRLESAQSERDGEVLWDPDMDHVRVVLLKLARGHASFEAGEPHTSEPDDFWAAPLSLLSPDERVEFENPDVAQVWPEVGSRAMQRVITGEDMLDGGWVSVQPGVYRYHVNWPGGIEVRIVLREYLACCVRWDA